MPNSRWHLAIPVHVHVHVPISFRLPAAANSSDQDVDAASRHDPNLETYQFHVNGINYPHDRNRDHGRDGKGLVSYQLVPIWRTY